MHVRVVMIRVHVSQGDSRPVSGMSDRMLRLHHAMQVQRRQEGDAQPDAEVADEVGQESWLLSPCNFHPGHKQRYGAVRHDASQPWPERPCEVQRRRHRAPA